MFNSDRLPHELFLTTRQTTKLRNAIENNMSADIILNETQIYNNLIWWYFRLFIRKNSWSIIKNCYTINNKSLTSFRIKYCYVWY